MKENRDSINRIVRVLLVIVFGVPIILGIVQGVLVWVPGIPGVIFLVTSLINRCPLYYPFGISIMRKAEGGESSQATTERGICSHLDGCYSNQREREYFLSFEVLPTIV